MNESLWWLLSGALVLVGIAGTVLPVLPGTILVLGGLLLGAWIDGFSKVGWLPLSGIVVLALLAWVADYAAAALGAKRAKASSLAVWGAAIGTLVGLAGGIVGVLLAPLLGAALGEWIARTFGKNRYRPTEVHDTTQAHPVSEGAKSVVSIGASSQTAALQGAFRVGLATGLALIVALAFKLAAIFAMIGIFALAYFW